MQRFPARAASSLFAVLLTLAPDALYADCGTQRWAVKTASDTDARNINTDAVDATIEQLSELQHPSGFKSRSSPRTKVESQVYVIEATLVTFFSEDDEDRHLVLNDGTGTMIAEIPNPDCVSSDSPLHDEIVGAWQDFNDHFHGKGSKKIVNEQVIVTGVAFFDATHNVGDSAPNFIELHPVTSIRFGKHGGGVHPILLKASN
ncbi:MAG TPA: hypothetical protein VN380_17965 [Thermoanaerobaculia bacterium]|jgi:hypothetical protein|nr:hypothetical protein [Thermoanaerobaculia bacterium]